MKKILTIDLDYFFLNCPRYQKYLDSEVDYETSWRVIKAYMPNEKFEPCLDSLRYVKNVLQKTCDTNTKVVVINEHNEILDVLRRYGHKNCEVINFDHHHDITYHNDDYEENIENWVQYGRVEGLIGQYSWIHQDNSKPCLNAPFQYFHESWKDVPLDIWEGKSFDMVVICISKHFTPIEYHCLSLELKGDIYDIQRNKSK